MHSYIYGSHRKTYTLIFLFILCTCYTYALEEQDVIGVWSTPKEKSKIEIFPCGEYYCGKIVWLREDKYPTNDPLGMGGKEIMDRNNHDPKLQNRPLIGLQLMEHFSCQGNLRWRKGLIYNPSNGNKYRCRMKLVSKEKLHVRGFLGISLIGKTSVWTRTDNN
ncbi:MAG: DUF2147 domain-containing protein [Chlamydiota bacterium]|nr:DUF2147 domain-containing protein [Chlamydiota bacterium]